MNVGVIGAGRIAHIVIPTVQQLPGITCLAIASREKERAEEFAKEHGIPKAYGSYEELLQDPEIDLVYIATPHSHHCEQMLQCIEHGKAVLSEKAFTANAEQAKKVREYAAKKGVFVAEAIWTRYMPSRKVIQEMLDSGIIGEVRFLTANLFYDIDDKERLVRRNLCGGALLDVGVYGLNFALMHFGQDLEKVESSVQMTEGGVDGQENITLFFKNGRMAAVQAGMFGRSDRRGTFYGEKGYIVVDNIHNPLVVTAYDDKDQIIKQVHMPEQISGYEYEFLECRKMLEEGEKESCSMPLSDTVSVMELMDELRAQWGLVYPGDEGYRK